MSKRDYLSIAGSVSVIAIGCGMIYAAAYAAGMGTIKAGNLFTFGGWSIKGLTVFLVWAACWSLSRGSSGLRQLCTSGAVVFFLFFSVNRPGVKGVFFRGVAKTLGEKPRTDDLIRWAAQELNGASDSKVSPGSAAPAVARLWADNISFVAVHKYGLSTKDCVNVVYGGGHFHWGLAVGAASLEPPYTKNIAAIAPGIFVYCD